MRRLSRAAPALAALLAGTVPAAADNAELHTFHCLHGCPAGAAAINDTIVREIYTLSSNDLTKLADWVAYRITPETIGRSGEREWQPDPWLSPDEGLETADYAGANAALGVDRGHQAPLAALSGTPTAADTNILSNITPQEAALNQAAWQRLEAAELTLVRGERRPVYVTTGPLYERVTASLPAADERHRVPSGYWKIVATDDGRAAAFIFDQATPRGASHCDMRATIEHVEYRTRMDLFPRVPAPFSRTLDAELGCRPLRPGPP